MMKRLLTCVVMVSALSLAACGGDDDNNGATNNGGTNNGTINNGEPNNGEPNNGEPNNGEPNNGEPNNGETNNTNAQCENAGDTCVEGAATAPGFLCATRNGESTCLEECVPPIEGEQYPCRSGQACGALTDGGATVCIPVSYTHLTLPTTPYV